MLGVERHYEVGLVNTQEQRAGRWRLRSRLQGSSQCLVILTLELPVSPSVILGSGGSQGLTTVLAIIASSCTNLISALPWNSQSVDDGN